VLANINELDLKADEVEVDFDSMPEPGGQFTPPPKPGSYKFTLPGDLSGIWEKVETKDGKDRIKALFDIDNPLVYSSIRNNKIEDEPWTTQLSNVEYSFRDGVKTSGMAQLLKHGLGEETTPRTNMEYAQALIRHAGESFIADVEWSTSCNASRDIRAYEEDEDGNRLTTTEVREGTPGCGKKFYQQHIPKNDDGTYMETFSCDMTGCDSPVPAVLRCFGNLRNFRPAN
jgi:hypothetical protein